jgi:hypothetical protein
MSLAGTGPIYESLVANALTWKQTRQHKSSAVKTAELFAFFNKFCFLNGMSSCSSPADRFDIVCGGTFFQGKFTKAAVSAVLMAVAGLGSSSHRTQARGLSPKSSAIIHH